MYVYICTCFSAWLKKTRKEREPQPPFRTVVPFVTWLISRTEFSSSDLFYIDTVFDVLFTGLDGDRKSCRVVCRIQARLYQMIVRSVLSVSCASCGAPLALT